MVKNLFTLVLLLPRRLLLMDKVRVKDKTCRCDERLKPKGEESTSFTNTELFEELEYLKIETRLIHEKFARVMGECVI